MNRQARGVRRASIHLNPDTLRRLDEHAKARGLSRSALVSEILRNALGHHDPRLQENRA